MRKMKIYISGPCSHLTMAEVTIAFGNAKSKLHRFGFDVVSPLDNGLDWNAPWAEHLLRDLDMMRGCQAVYMLSGWQQSAGAKMERIFAIHEGMYMFYEDGNSHEDK